MDINFLLHNIMELIITLG